MKLIVFQLTKQFHSYPTLCSQQSTTGLSRNPDEFSPHPDTVFFRFVFKNYPSI